MIKDLKKLQYQRLPYMWGGCHEALNGFWMDWWFSLDGKRLINNPGRKIQDQKKRWRTADIFFCKHKYKKLYGVAGIAEVENNPSKWFEKLKTLETYINAKVGKNKKFPTLKFVLLSIVYDEKPKITKENYEKIIKKAKEISEKVNQKVIIAKFFRSNIALKRNEAYAFLDMAGVGGENQRWFFIWKPFTGQIEIIVFYKGKKTKITLGERLVGKTKSQIGN